MRKCVEYLVGSSLPGFTMRLNFNNSGANLKERRKAFLR